MELTCVTHHRWTDNLAANYSRDLADYIIYVIDVAGGDKVPRKGGPGITQSDLLVSVAVLRFAIGKLCAKLLSLSLCMPGNQQD